VTLHKINVSGSATTGRRSFAPARGPTTRNSRRCAPAGGLVRRSALGQQLPEKVIGEHAMDAVAADQKPVVLAQPDGSDCRTP